MKKLRVAIIGLAHVHAIGMIKAFNNDKRTEIVGMADYPPYSEEELAVRLRRHVPDDIEVKLWEDYTQLLKANIDIAVICTDVKDHADIVETTLGMGIHTVVEKPMALDMAEAKRMYRAYKASTAQLVINWPIAWFSAFRKAKELSDSGIIGEVLRVHYRSPATCGPYRPGEFTDSELSKSWWYKHERGGGSISDYAGYGCVLTTWITGKTAVRVNGFKRNYFVPFSDVEDYATFTIDFGKSIGIIEASWSTVNNGQIPTGPVIYGSKGVIVSDRYEKEVKVYKSVDPHMPSGVPSEIYTPEPLNENAASNIVDFLTEGKPLFEMTTPEFNIRANAALDAGVRSCESGNTENTINPFGI